MMTMEEEIADGLADLAKETSISIVYHKNNREIVLTSVLKVTKKWHFTDDNLLSQHIETQDWIFEASEFGVIQQGEFEPCAGEEVSRNRGDGFTDIYQVVSVNKERVWRYCDPSETRVRLHTLFLRREENV